MLTFGFNVSVKDTKAIWSNVASDVALRMSEEMMIEIRIAINAAAKMAAIKQVQNTIQSSLASGGNDSPKYITNYREFLITSPHDQAKVVTENFLTVTLKGQTSGNYVSANFTGGEGVQISYQQYLSNIGQVVIEGGVQVEVDIMEICDPLEGLFSQGNWDCFETMMNNPINTPVGLAIATEGYLNQKTAEYQLTAQGVVQSSAGGFLPIVDVDGKVSLPSGVVAELQIKRVTLPIDAIANSDSEAFSVLIESFAMTAISNVVNYGLGEVNKQFQNSSSQFSSKFNLEYSSALETNGPEMMFNSNSLYE